MRPCAVNVNTTDATIGAAVEYGTVCSLRMPERDARSFLQMPSTRQIAAIAVLAVTTAACLWMLMRKAKEPNFTENGIRYSREPNGVCQLRLSSFGRCPGHNLLGDPVWTGGGSDATKSSCLDTASAWQRKCGSTVNVIHTWTPYTLEKLCAIPIGSEHHFLVVVAIFRNEADVLSEWLEHHLWQGVEHFFLIDNNSTDDWRTAVAPFAKHVSVRTENKRHQQARHINSWLKHLQARARWVLEIDVDEFVYVSPRSGFSDIPTYLRHVEKTNCTSTLILLHWQMFGSSDHVVQPPSVRLNFTRASLKPFHPDLNTKYIVRAHALTSMWIHFPYIGKNLYKRWQQPDPEHVLLNHYNILARERYKRVKMTRGAADSSLHEHIRTMEYFNTHDKLGNETDNVELRDLVLSAEPSRLRPSTSHPLTHRKPPYMHGFATNAGPRDTALVPSQDV